ncbi:hypothetical protein ACJRO7_025397 [Eucalyptus globulus]|uniref:Uncharacterized protein n=1 Tax=Eucalyptus globulus TaxID=34317 RepID=A0ABD3K8S1_EUCGL
MEVEIVSKEHVKLSSSTPAHLRTYRLSLRDQLVPTAHIPMILFYDRPTTFTTDEALRRLKQSASQALPKFYHSPAGSRTTSTSTETMMVSTMLRPRSTALSL